ncbi:MAG TPA: alpha-amylase family glycosyl hydrolase [Tepidisphaeraceae bacterium]|nr:alpha-amylase family glycosyl hydrolase [Tepidisphaeraceae bacterium]
MLRIGIILALAASAVHAAALPLGATPDDHGVTFRVWAPFVDSVGVTVNGKDPTPMAREAGHSNRSDDTWFAYVAGVKPGDHYRYVIRCNGVIGEFNDPRAIEVTSPLRNAWSVVVAPIPEAQPLPARALDQLVIYEMHIGTFHADDNGRFDFAGAAQKLDYLKDLNINAVELMPINENKLDRGHAPGDYNWGYDPLSYFAVKSAYGTPKELKEFIAQCHARGIAVILDVVYNHMAGGNFLERWGGFTTANLTGGVYFYAGEAGRSPWGPRPDYSRPQVRDYIADNVRMWFDQFGFDGIRSDSVSNIRNFSGARRSREQPNPDGITLLRSINLEFPDKIKIAEDLRSSALVTGAPAGNGLGFNSQWDNKLCDELRRTVATDDDDLTALADLIAQTIGDDAFGRVIYSEDHDQVGHPQDKGGGEPLIRLPAVIDRHDPQSEKARRLSTLAAAIVLTSPGVPMLFQGQELFDPRTFDFSIAADMDWSRVERFHDVLQTYHDLIALRRNLDGTTRGLLGQHTRVFQVDSARHFLAYRRWDQGGARDDVIVLVNLSDQPRAAVRFGLPSDGRWVARFRSDMQTSPATTATGDPTDGMNFSGQLTIGPYSVAILSQD